MAYLRKLHKQDSSMVGLMVNKGENNMGNINNAILARKEAEIKYFGEFRYREKSITIGNS